ncbi:hypothetical protein HDU96_000840 [Phlyctochytrium bullatum]|nr:hypothetical protein HDU96_000840 [Phlyctochytrium bullatum]
MKFLTSIAAFAAAAASVSAITISEIQGNRWVSPYLNQVVRDVRGVVTVVDVHVRGIYIQSLPEDQDNDPATSEALFLFFGGPQASVFDDLVYNTKVRPGQIVKIESGLVNETHATTSNQGFLNYQTSLQNIQGFSVVGNGVLPAPVRIGEKHFDLYYSPKPYSNEDPAGQKNLTAANEVLDLTRAFDYYESLESMYIEIVDPLVVQRAWNNFRQLPVVPNRGANAKYLSSAGGLTMTEDVPQPMRFLLENPINTDYVRGQTRQTPLPNAYMGDHLDTLTGTLSWRFDSFHVRPNVPVNVAKSANQVFQAPRVSRDNCNLVVGSYNIENFNGQNATRTAALAGHIVNQLQNPDILFVQEMGDDDGVTQSQVVTSDRNLGILIDAIVAAGGPRYEFTYVAPQVGTDGGQPGLNIRNAYLYLSDRVSLASSPSGKGGALDAVEVLRNAGGQPILKYNPGRIDPTNPAYDASRKPLLAHWTFAPTGQSVFTVNNHLSSKGGSSPVPFGMLQPQINGGYSKRIQQIDAIAKIVNDILAVDPNAVVLMGGDQNEFYFVGAMDRMETSTPLKNMHRLNPPQERYSYTFDGLLQTLDHLFAPACALTNAQLIPIHVNTWGRQQSISDHDPVLARLDICGCLTPAKPTTTTTTTSSTTTTTTTSTSSSTSTTSTTSSSSTTTTTTTSSSSSSTSTTSSTTSTTTTSTTSTVSTSSTSVALPGTSSTTSTTSATAAPGTSATTVSTSAAATASTTTPCDETTTTKKTATTTTTPCDETTTKPSTATSSTKPVATTTTTPCDETTKAATTTKAAATTTSTKAVATTDEPCDDEASTSTTSRKPVATAPGYVAPPALSSTKPVAATATPTSTPKPVVPAYGEAAKTTAASGKTTTAAKNIVVSGAQGVVAGVVGAAVAVAVAVMAA